MNTINPQHPVGKSQERINRQAGDSPLTRGSQGKDPSSSPMIKNSLLDKKYQIRQQIIGLQRSISRTQRILGGLDGLKSFVESGGSLRQYVSQITYKGEEVLSSYADKLTHMVEHGDFSSLEPLITQVRDRIGELAGKLSRYETAEQNTRALSLEPQKVPVNITSSLQQVLDALREQEQLPYHLKPENVLNLLS